MHVLAQLPQRTGSGVYFTNLIERLKAYGHEQRAVYAVQGGDDFACLPTGCRAPVCFKSEALPFPVPGMSDEMPYESTVYGRMDEEQRNAWLAAFGERLREERDAFAPDAVVLHHLWMLTSLGAEVFTDAVKVAVCHNTDLRQAEMHPHLRERYVAHLDKLDAVLALSARQKPVIAKLYGLPESKMLAVGGGYNEAFFYPPSSRRGERETVECVYAGKLVPSKGVFELVRAFQKACARMPALRLTLVGDARGKNAARLDALCGDAQNIRRLPAMPQPELGALFRQMDVFALPSYYEGIALSAIEALACGLLCVTSEIPDLMELLRGPVNESGAIEYVLLPRLAGVDSPLPEDVDAYVDALCAALLRQGDRAKSGGGLPPGAAKQVGELSWRSIAAKVNGLLEELASARIR